MSSIGVDTGMPSGTSFPSNPIPGDQFFREDLDTPFVFTVTSGWVSIIGSGGVPDPHASSHQHGGSDEVATLTPSAYAIPKADATGSLDAWVSAEAIPVLTSDPIPPDPKLYFNSVLKRLMYYDNDRSKYLTIECISWQVGEEGETPPGAYFKGLDGRALSATLGYVAGFNGSLVGLVLSRNDSDAASLEVQVNGSVGATVTSSSTTTIDMGLDVIFNQGDVLSVKNADSSVAMSDSQILLFMRWRA